MKKIVVVVLVIMLLAILFWWLGQQHGSNAGEWNANKAFLRECVASKTRIQVDVDFGSRKGMVPDTRVAEAIQKLSSVSIRMTDSPYQDDYDMLIVVTDQKGRSQKIYAWANRAPYLSQRARSDVIGPWFAKYTRRNNSP